MNTKLMSITEYLDLRFIPVVSWEHFYPDFLGENKGNPGRIFVVFTTFSRVSSATGHCRLVFYEELDTAYHFFQNTHIYTTP